MAISTGELCGVCELWAWHHPGREAQFLIFDNSQALLMPLEGKRSWFRTWSQEDHCPAEFFLQLLW